MHVGQHAADEREHHVVAHKQALARLGGPLDPAVHGLQQRLEPAVAVERDHERLGQRHQRDGAGARDAAADRGERGGGRRVGAGRGIRGDGLSDVTTGRVHAGEEGPTGAQSKTMWFTWNIFESFNLF